MIPLTFFYDEYIEQPKWSEQKNQFEYIVPPPTSGVVTTRFKMKNVSNGLSSLTDAVRLIEH